MKFIIPLSLILIAWVKLPDPMSKLDKEISKVVDNWNETVEEVVSNEFKSNMSIRLSNYFSPEALKYNLSKDDLTSKINNIIGRSLHKNVRLRESKNKDLKNYYRYLPNSKVKMVNLYLPQYELSEKKKLSRMIITVYICPDNITSKILFLYRALRSLIISKKNFQIEQHNLRAEYVDINTSGYEKAYTYEHAYIYSGLIKEGELDDVKDRLGVIRKNVVIEFQATTYYKHKNVDQWCLSRMDSEDHEFIKETLSEIGKKLK